MKKVRILSLLLAMVMLCSLFFVGCGDEEKKTGGGGNFIVDTETEDTSKMYTAEVKDLHGHEFRFTVRDTSTNVALNTHEVYAETSNGDKINDAVYARNSQLQEKYNCTIVEERVTTGSLVSNLKDPLTAGEYVTDFILQDCSRLLPLAESNLLADLSKVKTIDLSKAWWDQNGLFGMNLGGKIFFVNGDGLTLDDRAAWIMCFNKEFVKEYTNKNLYEEVDAGRWTIDLMYDIVENTAKDNGDGVWTVGDDRFGYIGGAANNAYHIWACGITLANVDDKGNWTIPDQPKEAIITAWDELRPLLTTQKRHNYNAGFQEYFGGGKGTFFCNNAGILMGTGQLAVDYGILPMPKLNEQQDKYYTGVSYLQLGCFAIPNTVESATDWASNGFESGVEQAAYFLEAYSYYSMQILTPAFIDQVCLKQAVRDDDSARMVELAVANKIYDPIMGYKFGDINIFSKVGTVGKNNSVADGSNYDTLVSTYTSRVTAARKALDEYLAKINTEA